MAARPHHHGMMATNKMEPRQHCQIRIDDDECIAPLSQVVDRVHQHGGKIVAQLVVMGSAILMPETPEGETRIIFSPSGVTEKVGKWTQESQALTVDQIHELTDAVAKAAARAKKAGFDGVQFHGAHGYLASKFLSPHFNTRTDAYGGSLENRARFLLECIAAMRQAVGADYPIWVKLNCADFMKDGSLTFEESKQVMAWLADQGVNAIEVSGGNTSSLPRKGPIRAIRRTKEPMYFKAYAAEAAALLKGKIRRRRRRRLPHYSRYRRSPGIDRPGFHFHEPPLPAPAGPAEPLEIGRYGTGPVHFLFPLLRCRKRRLHF